MFRLNFIIIYRKTKQVRLVTKMSTSAIAFFISDVQIGENFLFCFFVYPLRASFDIMTQADC